ncbi:hypothetical protein [Paraburkholderia tropica]|uniref:hypothetical protein n=1 Tax=Paraburkholderia tropica TaxID=92647 RepID=UPI003D29A7C7
MLSLYGVILPQIIRSFDSSLENCTEAERQSNHEKLKQSLGRIDEYFSQLESVLRENQKTEKNMEFDSAISFADARFKLASGQEDKTSINRNLKMTH